MIVKYLENTNMAQNIKTMSIPETFLSLVLKKKNNQQKHVTKIWRHNIGSANLWRDNSKIWKNFKNSLKIMLLVVGSQGVFTIYKKKIMQFYFLICMTFSYTDIN